MTTSTQEIARRRSALRRIGHSISMEGGTVPAHVLPDADEYARAVMIAQSRLAAFTAVEQVEEKNAEGTEDRYRWRVTAAAYDERRETPSADANRDLNLRVRLLRVDAIVAWSAADGRERDVRLATLVLAAKP